MVLLQQMIALLIFMITGYAMRRKGVFSPQTSRDISWLIVNVSNPCLLLSGVFASEKPLTGADMRITLLLCLYVYSILIAASLALPVLLRVPKEERGVWRVMTAFSNIGFMGFPLLQVLFGPESLVYGSIFTIFFTLLVYTYGSGCLRKDVQKGPGAFKSAARTLLLNVGTISGILALIFAFRKPPVPLFVTSVVDRLGAVPTSLSMLVIGASLTEIRLHELFTDVRLLLFAAAKLIVIPLVSLLAIRPLLPDQLFLGVSMIMLSTPTASMVVMLAHQHDADYVLASRGVALTTILSVATMPLVSFLIGL